MTVLPFRRRRRPESGSEHHRLPVEQRPREAIVFSGGGSLGAAQVGALRAIFEAGIRPDLVVGCSVGALNAAFLAVDPTPARVVDLQRVWLGLHYRDVFPDGRFDIARRLIARQDHLQSPHGLDYLIERWVPVADLAETQIPVQVVTTDLLAGRARWWDAGDPRDVLRASACLPLLFPPVELDGTLHVDGGVTCPVPVQRALDLGAERVWVLDVSSDFHGWGDGSMNALDVLLESFAVSRSLLGQRSPVANDDQQVVNLPPLGIGRHDLRDFSRTRFLLAAGLVAGRKMVADALANEPGRASETGESSAAVALAPSAG